MVRIAACVALASSLAFAASRGRCEASLQPGDSFKDCPGCPEMVVVPASSFMMGSADGEPGHDASQGPQHKVTITAPFAVGRFPVTFAEWDACMAGGACGGYRPDDAGWGRGERPVINVSWHDAKAYVAWLSKKAGKTYRLLSESEREYVTRAGTKTPFWWGSTVTPDQANYNGAYIYAGTPQKGEYRAKTVPVYTFQPNAWGLYQVHGNIWEWVEDCWHPNYQGAPADSQAWTGDTACRRVLRGGSWDRIPQVLTAASRISFSASYRYNMIGFRVAKSEAGGLIKLPPRPAPAVTLARAPAAGPQQAAGPTVTLVSSDPPVDQEKDGFVDEWRFGEGTLVLKGWGLWQPELAGRLLINTNLPASKASIQMVARPDVIDARKDARLAHSGFEVTIFLNKEIPLPDKRRVCVWTQDPEFGSRRTSSWELCP